MSAFAQHLYTILWSLIIGGFITLAVWPIIYGAYDAMTTKPETQGAIIRKDKSEL